MASKPETDDVTLLDSWYRSKCDGNWEHRWGITIQTCDNPGWLLTFNDLPLNNQVLARIRDQLPRNKRAEVDSDGQQVRVFAPALADCLAAATRVIEISREHKRA